MRVRLVRTGPPNHLEAVDQVFLIDRKIAKKRLVSLLLFQTEQVIGLQRIQRRLLVNDNAADASLLLLRIIVCWLLFLIGFLLLESPSQIFNQVLFPFVKDLLVLFNSLRICQLHAPPLVESQGTCQLTARNVVNEEVVAVFIID